MLTARTLVVLQSNIHNYDAGSNSQTQIITHHLNNTSSSAVARQSLSCETSGRRQSLNKNRIRSEKNLARHPTLYLHTGL